MSNILKPYSASRRYRATRRKRPIYPAHTSTSSTHDVARPECGRNVAIKVIGSKEPRRVTHGTFIFERDYSAPSRSKYAPHAGKKQLARAA